MAQTHSVSISGAAVTKTYVDWSRGEHLREWDALEAITAAAADLVPAPLALTTVSDRPCLSMRLLPGRPLAGALAAEELDGLELALRELWAVPADGLRPISHQSFAHQQLESVSSWQGTGIVAEAHAAAAEWLRGSAVDQLAEPGVPVIGHGDPNLSNYLWDGARVRIVDFEDAGRSDLATELANLVEHISSRETEWDLFVSRFQVDAHRFWAARCLWATFWLTLLRPGGRSASRNPPGTGDLQAARLLSLLRSS